MTSKEKTTQTTDAPSLDAALAAYRELVTLDTARRPSDYTGAEEQYLRPTLKREAPVRAFGSMLLRTNPGDQLQRHRDKQRTAAEAQLVGLERGAVTSRLSDLFAARIPDFDQAEGTWPSQTLLEEQHNWPTDRRGAFPDRLTWQTDPAGVKTINVHSDTDTVNGVGEFVSRDQHVVSWNGEGDNIQAFVGETTDPRATTALPDQIPDTDTLAINRELVRTYALWSDMLTSETAWQPPFVNPTEESAV